MRTIRTNKAFNVLFLLAGAVVVQASSACILGARTGPGVAHADTAKTVECGDYGTMARIDMAGYSATDLIEGKAHGVVEPSDNYPGASLISLLFVAGEGVVYLQCSAKGPAVFTLP